MDNIKVLGLSIIIINFAWYVWMVIKELQQEG